MKFVVEGKIQDATERQDYEGETPQSLTVYYQTMIHDVDGSFEAPQVIDVPLKFNTELPDLDSLEGKNIKITIEIS